MGIGRLEQSWQFTGQWFPMLLMKGWVLQLLKIESVLGDKLHLSQRMAAEGYPGVAKMSVAPRCKGARLIPGSKGTRTV